MCNNTDCEASKQGEGLLILGGMVVGRRNAQLKGVMSLLLAFMSLIR